MNNWNIDTARDYYNIDFWGNGYFDIGNDGHLTVRPLADPDHAGIDMYRLVEEIREMGLTTPVLVRFSDILQHRAAELHRSFAGAMAGEGYRGGYTAAYPIKVNQQHSVIEQLLATSGAEIGLEAGSKPELMAVLALTANENGIVICNGYKDRDYIRLALLGSRLGHKIYIVVEKLSELDLIVKESTAMGINPLLGMRIRLASIGKGRWQNTGGEKAKFGLSVAQVFEVIGRLRAADMLVHLRMMHFHMGSQIPNIQDIQRGMGEAARYYAELRSQGIDIECVNVGGGLSVDYEGTRSHSYFSANYSIQEYAKNIVRPLREICDQHNLPHPNIVTESGRSMVAHHAVLVTNVIDIEQAPSKDKLAVDAEKAAPIIHDLFTALNSISSRSAVEAYHDAVHLINEAQTMFNHGVVDLAERAIAEQIYSAICLQVRQYLRNDNPAHREVIDELNEKLADKYFCNFSLFQSMPDTWAINQIFPIVPLHRLDERPCRRVVIQDLTCDSDGRVDRYVDNQGISSTLLLHELADDRPYLIGVFLVGAYQEILGDMHNLFGDTDSIHVKMTGNRDYELVQPLRGDTIAKVLQGVNFDPGDLLKRLENKIKRAQSFATEKQRRSCLAEFEQALGKYTYLGR